MRFANPHNPTESELRAWAADGEAAEPAQDWELILAWHMDPSRLRALVDLAADPSLPHARFCLLALYQWVAYAAERPDFDGWRRQYDRWLDEARGVREPAVKRWRHAARLVVQGVEAFDRDRWWSVYAAETEAA
jgi:hypothetical protein